MTARTMVALGLALLCGAADAVPASSLQRLTWERTIEVDAAFAQSASPSEVEGALAQMLTEATGFGHIAASVGATAHRRLQASTSLTIQYTVTCGTDCGAISEQMNTFATDPDAGLAHAAGIIAAINQASTAAGFGEAVLSSPADVVATITAPDSVSITLPPIPPAPAPLPPAPAPAPAPMESCKHVSHTVRAYQLSPHTPPALCR